MRDKSGADYGKSSFSRGEAQEYVERTEEYRRRFANRRRRQLQP